MSAHPCAPEHLPLARLYHWERERAHYPYPVSYTHLRAHET